MKSKLIMFLCLGVLTTKLSAKEESKEKCQIGYPMATVNRIADVLATAGATKELQTFKHLVYSIDSVIFSEKLDWHKNPVSTVTLAGETTVQGDIACGRLTLSVTRSYKRTNDPIFPTYPVFSFKVNTSKLFDSCREDVRNLFKK